jgi:hypothetical protein
MRSKDFIEALYEAGWRSAEDTQHENIYKLWCEIFPTAAALELELDDLLTDYEKLLKLAYA